MRNKQLLHIDELEPRPRVIDVGDVDGLQFDLNHLI